MAVLGLVRQMISNLNIQEINVNLSNKRPRTIAANRCSTFVKQLYIEYVLENRNKILRY